MICFQRSNHMVFPHLLLWGKIRWKDEHGEPWCYLKHPAVTYHHIQSVYRWTLTYFSTELGEPESGFFQVQNIKHILGYFTFLRVHNSICPLIGLTPSVRNYNVHSNMNKGMLNEKVSVFFILAVHSMSLTLKLKLFLHIQLDSDF